LRRTFPKTYKAKNHTVVLSGLHSFRSRRKAGWRLPICLDKPAVKDTNLPGKRKMGVTLSGEMHSEQTDITAIIPLDY